MTEIMNADEARLLNAAEQEAVGHTLQPALTKLSRHELQALAVRLREARDRARTIASQQRREIRGKAEPRGATPARDDAGTFGKEQVLADALRRVTERLGQTADESDAPKGADGPIIAPGRPTGHQPE